MKRFLGDGLAEEELLSGLHDHPIFPTGSLDVIQLKLLQEQLKAIFIIL